jgi:hypothetical protein
MVIPTEGKRINNPAFFTFTKLKIYSSKNSVICFKEIASSEQKTATKNEPKKSFK